MNITVGHAIMRDPLPGLPVHPVNQYFSVPTDMLIPGPIATAAATSHPRRVVYRVPASCRAAAHALSHPGTTLSGFGALALFGLPALVDMCDTVLINPKIGRKVLATSTRPGMVRGSPKPQDVWRVFFNGEVVQLATPPLATIQALKALRRGEAGWEVETVEDDPVFVRAVQLVDAVRRFLGVTPESLVLAGHKLIDDRWLASVISSSSALADSPKETEMRLILARFAGKHGFTYREQLPVRKRNRLVTTLDAALVEPRYGFMYDGIHHWTKQQRVKDAEINIELQLLQIRPLRFATGTLRSIPAVTEALLRKDGFI
ncbi:hypothetical protein [Corynebacterium sp. HMSC034A01]|uniref:hypothetical protein n=1 Tax=Corynebacterium sp. HMSC034A01 TaxID=1739295 RepID=UPI00091745FF|nr:hypothetical protein [Corynebacterium sp. HMSC034A01]OHR18206.1 hypothetical protein HMPREF2791_00645 [Corynebacterium sp. HMSC034A01]